jgi:hypothetical protein
VLRILLSLHARNDLASARELQKIFSEWLAATGSETRILRSFLAIQWSIARELGNLGKSFPTELRAMIARAALAGDLGCLQNGCCRYRRSAPNTAAEAADLLRSRAPSLAASLADALAPPRQSSTMKSAPVWTYIISTIILLRLLSTCMQSSNRPSTSPHRNSIVLEDSRPPEPLEFTGSGRSSKIRKWSTEP